jgi:hypothetical protein
VGCAIHWSSGGSLDKKPLAFSVKKNFNNNNDNNNKLLKILIH